MKKSLFTALLLVFASSLLAASPPPHHHGSPPQHRLFSDTLRTLQPSPVYDFLERALAVQASPSPEDEVMLRKVVFVKGSWDVVRQLTPADECSIENVDGKAYMVTWRRGDTDVVSLFFPIDYELLGGKPRRQLEHDFVDGLRAYVPDASLALPDVKVETLRHLSGDSLAIADGRQAKGPQLSPEASLSLEFPFTDHSQQVLTMPLRQLMQYCQSQGCTPYYIYDGADDTASLLLLLLNNDAGYGHVVSLDGASVPASERAQSLSGRVSMFLPFAQVTTLSALNPKQKSTPKRYE